jgi:hypothetical protein
MNHVHHDLIVAWAKGAKIEFWNDSKDRWENSSTPLWTVSSLYRIKPEPKPDVVLYQTVEYRPEHQRAVSYIKTKKPFATDNVMFIFDGETGALKDAQVLVN